MSDKWTGIEARLRNGQGGTWTRKRALRALAQGAAEFEAVAQFASLADELGLHVPDRDLTCSGQTYIDDFVGGCSVGCNEAFGYAQHHGVPTRLLDWTRRAIVAAFFATERDHRLATDIAVWALNIDLLPAGCFHCLTCDRSKHAFLHAQDAMFVWVLHAERFFEDRAEWPEFTKVLDAKDASSALKKLILDGSQVDALASLLWRERVTRAHLMPVFDNVAVALRRRWRLPSRESGQARAPRQ